MSTSHATPRRDHESWQDNGTYQTLLQAARKLIAAFGYHNVTIDEIRRCAGVSRATFYFYFRRRLQRLLSQERIPPTDTTLLAATLGCPAQCW